MSQLWRLSLEVLTSRVRGEGSREMLSCSCILHIGEHVRADGAAIGVVAALEVAAVANAVWDHPVDDGILEVELPPL